jgi:putative transposase
VEHVRDSLDRDRASERRACRVLGQPRSTQRRAVYVPDDEPRLVKEMTEIATQYGRYGYRRITALLCREGWEVHPKRIKRLWRRRGAQGTARKAKTETAVVKRGFLHTSWVGYRNHVWSYDFMADRTHDGRPLCFLTIVDEYTRECLAIDVERRMNHQHVLDG